jgi:hypothetical protein
MDGELQKRVGTIGTKTANEVFKILTKHFKSSTSKDVTRLQSQLVTLAPRKSERPSSYLYRFKDIVEELAGHNVLTPERTQFDNLLI